MYIRFINKRQSPYEHLRQLAEDAEYEMIDENNFQNNEDNNQND